MWMYQIDHYLECTLFLNCENKDISLKFIWNMHENLR